MDKPIRFDGDPDLFSRIELALTGRNEFLSPVVPETRLQKLLRWFREAYREAREQAKWTDETR